MNENTRITREKRRMALKKDIREHKILIEAAEDMIEKIENEVAQTIDWDGEKIPKTAESARRKRLRAELVGNEPYERQVEHLAHLKAEKAEFDDLISGIDYSQRDREIEAQRELAAQLKAFTDNIGLIAEILDSAKDIVASVENIETARLARAS